MKVQQSLWTAETGWTYSCPCPEFNTKVQLALVFGGLEQLKCARAFETISNRYPNAHIFGCTTAGEVQESSVYDGSVTLTAVCFDSSTIKTSQIKVTDSHSSYTAGIDLVRELPKDGLRHIFLLTDGLNINGTELSRGINACVPNGVSVTGGFAAVGYQGAGEAHVWCDGKPQQGSVIAIGLYGAGLRIGTSVTHGWEPFGADRIITKSVGNVMYELDGEPVLGLYKRYLGEHAANLPLSGFVYPIEITNSDTSERIVRTVVAVNEGEQSITFAGDVPQMSTARLMIGNPEKLIESAYCAAEESLNCLEAREVQLSILVSCLGRRPVMKQRIEEEIEAVRDTYGLNTPTTGFYSHGEIAPFTKTGKIVLHNQTLTLTCFAEV